MCPRPNPGEQAGLSSGMRSLRTRVQAVKQPGRSRGQRTHRDNPAASYRTGSQGINTPISISSIMGANAWQSFLSGNKLIIRRALTIVKGTLEYVKDLEQNRQSAGREELSLQEERTFRLSLSSTCKSYESAIFRLHLSSSRQPELPASRAFWKAPLLR
jgi:hypothetical protein